MVVTSRAEREFNTRLGEAKRELSNLEKEIKVKDAEIKKKTTEEALATVTEHADQLRPIIVQLGGTVITQQANLYGVDAENNVGGIVQVKGESNYNASFSKQVPKSKVLKALEEERAELITKKAETEQLAMSWKKKLTQIPSLERQYKAKIAEAKLSQSADGKEMLDLLTADLDKNMLALPGF